MLERAIGELDWASKNVPFFEDLCRSSGIVPSQLRSGQDYRRVPTTTKSDYRVNFPARILATHVRANDPYLQRSQSSGSAGDRLVTVAFRYDLADRMRRTTSVHPSFQQALAQAIHQHVCRYAAPNCSDVECSTPFSTMRDRVLPDKTLVLPVAHDVLATPCSLVEKAIDEVSQYRPDWLYVDPTHLAFLVRECERRQVHLPEVSAIALTYTRTTAAARRRIHGHFGDIPTPEIVSMSELGWLAMECERGNLHINTESFYCEFLDDQGEPSPVGSVGELVCTSLGDEACPHIRYRTGDYYRILAQVCPCGHRFPLVQLEGRASDMLVSSTGVVMTPRAVDEIVGRHRWVEVYQARQRGRGKCVLEIIVNSDYGAADLGALHAEMESYLGGRLSLELREVEHLPSERSGKFISCSRVIGSES